MSWFTLGLFWGGTKVALALVLVGAVVLLAGTLIEALARQQPNPWRTGWLQFVNIVYRAYTANPNRYQAMRVWWWSLILLIAGNVIYGTWFNDLGFGYPQVCEHRAVQTITCLLYLGGLLFVIAIIESIVRVFFPRRP